MGSYKHIETCIGGYIAKHYADTVEVGIGKNTDAAFIILNGGARFRCTDIKDPGISERLCFTIDDIFSPYISLYRGADLIYAIRPAVEMIPPLLVLARTTNCDLIVYHLGFECYGNGGEKIDCGVLLHRYFKASEPVEQC
jgi:uncharacterized UPF0146 family protein